MKAVQFPPLCPFGDDDDAATFRLPSSRHVVWNMTEANDTFLRLSIYEDGELSYSIANRAETEQDLFDRYHELEDLVTFDEGSAEKFLEWGFEALVRKCGDPKE